MTKRVRTELSAAQARRVALAAQGFDRPRAVTSPRAISAAVERLGLLQIDSVNVLERAHYLPLFARLGPYDRAALDKLAWYAPRRLFEYWGHEASLIPVATQPLLRWRMERAAHEAWGGMQRIATERPELLEEIVEELRERGPLPARAFDDGTHRKGPWWDWSDTKRALEFLFWSGRVTSARRRRFERWYDLPEKVLPRAVLDTPTPPEADAQRELLALAGRALGVATETDLRDYFRIGPRDAAPRVAELVEDGRLLPVGVEGWAKPGYLWHEARVPRAVDATALVGPFDPLVWERPRAERLFGFRYRIEIYVPAEKRVHGYYVLPFLLGDRLVARVDLKSDRRAGVLRAQSVHYEEHAPAETADALRAELELMSGWLGLDGVSWP